VSQAKHWCEYCKIFIGGHNASIAFHENGRKHKEIVELFMKDMRTRGRERRAEENEVSKEMEKIEREAMKQYITADGGGSHAGAGGAARAAPSGGGGGAAASADRASRLAELEAKIKAARELPSGAVGPPPPGWKVKANPDGRFYYIHEVTGATQWEKPGAVSSFPDQPAAWSGVAAQPQPATGGWEQGLSPEGVPYFYHVGRGVTQWDAPPEWAAVHGAQGDVAAGVGHGGSGCGACGACAGHGDTVASTLKQEPGAVASSGVAPASGASAVAEVKEAAVSEVKEAAVPDAAAAVEGATAGGGDTPKEADGATVAAGAVGADQPKVKVEDGAAAVDAAVGGVQPKAKDADNAAEMDIAVGGVELQTKRPGNAATVAASVVGGAQPKAELEDGAASVDEAVGGVQVKVEKTEGAAAVEASAVDEDTPKVNGPAVPEGADGAAAVKEVVVSAVGEDPPKVDGPAVPDGAAAFETAAASAVVNPVEEAVASAVVEVKLEAAVPDGSAAVEEASGIGQWTVEPIAADHAEAMDEDEESAIGQWSVVEPAEALRNASAAKQGMKRPHGFGKKNGDDDDERHDVIAHVKTHYKVPDVIRRAAEAEDDAEDAAPSGEAVVFKKRTKSKAGFRKK